MIARAVIGANFGDEGKGVVTDYLCSQGAGTVVRFNGGAQAGHTVVTPDGRRHIFRHVGAGAFHNIPTFLSQFFVCNPLLFFRELSELEDVGVRPSVYAHPDCVITTFPDMIINQELETGRGSKRHGSCGIGFAETINRSRIDELKITMGDLWNNSNTIPIKLERICDEYARFRIGRKIDEPEMVEAFLKACEAFAQYINSAGIAQCKDPVFEGAQGLLLDQDNKEYYPHLTRSNTGMKNVRTLCAMAGIDEIETYYVSRTYLTRHGAGPLPSEDITLRYKDNTNIQNTFQGTFRFAPLDSGLIKRCTQNMGSEDYKLALTHTDQVMTRSLSADLLVHGPTVDDVQSSKSVMKRKVIQNANK